MLKMREIPEYQRAPVRAAVLTALVFGLAMGVGAGYVSAPSAAVSALPDGVQSPAQTQAALDLCAAGYTVWADNGTRWVCGSGGSYALNPSELRGASPFDGAALAGGPDQ